VGNSILNASSWILQNGYVAASLGGPNGITKNGVGTITAVANNFNANYAQTSTAILGGAYYLPTASSAPLGSTTVASTTTINGGALVFGSFSAGTLSTSRLFVLGASPTNVIDAGTTGAVTIPTVVTGLLADGGLQKTGTGTLSFTVANTYMGNTTIWNGDFRAAPSLGLPDSSALILRGGTFTGNATAGSIAFTRSLGTSIGSVSWAPNADGGFAAFGGNVNVNIKGNSTPDTLVWGSTADFVQSGRALILGSTTASGAVSILNPIDLNGSTRTIIVPLGTGTDSATVAGGLLNTAGVPAGLIKAGGSPLIFTAAPGYGGDTTIAAGSLQFVSGSLPAGNIALAGGILQLNGSSAQSFALSLGSDPGQIRWIASGGFAAIGGGVLTVNINGHTTPDTLMWDSTPYFVTAGNSLLFGSITGTTGITFKNPIDLNGGTRTIGVLGGTTSVTLTNGSLTKIGAGTLSLNSGTSLDAAGSFTVTAGTLNYGTLALSVANADIAGTLNGTGVITVSSAITLRDGATISNPFAGAAGLMKIGVNSATIFSANTYTGPTEIDGVGRLAINGGSIMNTSAIMINGGVPTNCSSITGAAYPSLGGSLVLVSTNGQDRIKTPATGTGTLPLTINGGFMAVAGIASGTSAITQNFAALTLGSGAAGLFLSPNSGVSGQTIFLNFNPASGSGLVTTAGSTLLIGGPLLGGTTTRVTFSGTLPASGTGSVSGSGSGITLGVLRGVFGDIAATIVTGSANQFTFAAAGSGMATYDVNGVRLLTAGEYQSTGSITGFVPTANANIKINAGTVSLVDGASTTINSLLMASSSTAGAILNLASTTATSTLTISSGNVLFSGGNNSTTAATPTIGNGITGGAFTLAFGGTQANFIVGNPTSATTTNPIQLRAILSAKVTGSDGFAKSGPGILTWTTLNGNSSITGGAFYLNGGILSVADIGNTIGTTLPLSFSGGILQYTGTAANPASIVAVRTGAVVLNAAGGTYDTQPGGGSFGGGTAFGSLQMPNSAVVFSGVVSGVGGLTKTGTAGGLVLQNNNTYSGGTTLNGGYLVLPTVDPTGTSLLTSQLGNSSAPGNVLTLTTGTLMPAGSNAVPGGESLTVSLPVNLGGESIFSYIGPTGASPGFTPYAAANAIPARLTFSGPMTITTGQSHVFTNNNPANVGGFSLILSGNIGESSSGSSLLFTGIGNSMPPGGPPLYAPVMGIPAYLTNISITGVNSYTGQTTVRQGIVNPNASIIAGQNGPFGNSYLPIVIGDPGGGTFAGVLLDGNDLTVSRNIQLQIAGTGGAAAAAVAPIYLGTLPGNTGGAITGNIQLANRTLFLFSGGGTITAPMVVSGTISDSGNVVFGGLAGNPNTVTRFDAANSYTGGTSVFVGTLLVNNTTGSGTGTGAVNVGINGTLGGNGSITGPITVSGTLMPGTSAATPQLNAGAVTFGANSVLRATLFGTGANQIGTLNANSIDGSPQIVLDLSKVDAGALRSAVGNDPRTYTIIQSSTPLSNFTPTDLTLIGIGNFNSSEWSISSSSVGNTVQLTFSPVPEPASILLIGAFGLAALRRRRSLQKRSTM
jgi:autotransporter-associated beta strand protein